MLILYIVFLFAALYWVAKILLPEMSKPPLSKVAPESKTSVLSQSNGIDNRVMRMETLLTEKSKKIQLLQTELQIFQAELRDFDKIKILLEDEIHRLREQNRIFRSELGLPAAQLHKMTPALD